MFAVIVSSVPTGKVTRHLFPTKPMALRFARRFRPVGRKRVGFRVEITQVEVITMAEVTGAK
jgi:hypothetical protein